MFVHAIKIVQAYLKKLVSVCRLGYGDDGRAEELEAAAFRIWALLPQPLVISY
jgi:hypothetical protein